MATIGQKISGVAVAAVLGLVALGGAQAAEKIKVTMAATSSNYAPYFTAIQRGYFAEEGFDVEIVKAGGGTATPALMSGSVDFSTSGASALSAILRGAPIKLVFFPWFRPTYQIWSTTPEVSTAEDMKGKTIGIQTRGDTFEIAVRIVLMNRNIDPNSVSYTPLGYGGGRLAAIKSGSLPVVVLSQIDIGSLAGSDALKRGKMLVDTFNEVKMPYTGIAVSAKSLTEDRDRVVRFVRASLKGLMYSEAFKDRTVSYVMKYAKADKEAVELDYDSVVAKSSTKDGTIGQDLQRQDVELRASLLGMDKSKIRPLDEIFDFSVTVDAKKSLEASGWKPVL